MKEGPRTRIAAALPPSLVTPLHLSGGGPRGTGVLAIALGFAVVALGAGGYLALRQRTNIRKGAEPFIQAVANFRAGELGRWLAERQGDAQVASRDSIIAAAAAVPRASRVASPAFVQAGRRLEIIARSYGYQAAAVLDAKGTRLLAYGEAIDVTHPEVQTSVAAVMANQRVQMSRLILSGRPPNQVQLDIVAPLLLDAPAGGLQAVGALVLRIDVRDIVATVLGVDPNASTSAQLALVARSGAGAVTLLPSRLRAGQPWIVELGPGSPRETAPLLAATGLVTGAGSEDEGQRAGAAAPVAGVPWTVLGSAAIAEFVGPSIRALWLMCGLFAAVLMGTALLAYSLWKGRSERALRASEEKFRTIFENMQDGYLLADLPGEIKLVNPAAVRMLGYQDAQELCGKSMDRDVFANPDDRVALKAKLRDNGGVVHGHKATFKRKDGSKVIIEGHVRMVYDSSGTPIGIEGVVRDMTAHYEVREELIRAREAALAAAEIKSQFLANMSHEIRTPLNAIVGLGHLLARTELTPQLAGYVGNIQASVRMLLDVVNNVLDFSKIEAGHLTLEVIPFRLDEVLRGVEKVLAVPARDKGLELICALDAKLPPTMLGDPTRLGQVLTNLAGNAVKFTAAGKVSLRIDAVEQRLDRAVVRFVVEDTGIGIASDRASLMFEPFVQADGSTTRQFGGTGLGLAISQQLVGAMGGQLTCQSTLGQGSTFGFTLTLVVPTATRLTPPALAPVSLRGARLLVVEDNVINQQVARELLEGVGAIVAIADNGRAAVDLVLGAGPRYDAVLMDLQMPGMDGFEAAREIRRHPTRGDLPIIAMTAHAFEHEKGKCLAAGMNDHVAKPVEPPQLFAALLRWVVPAGAPAAGQPPEADAVAGAPAPLPPPGGRLVGIDTAAGLRRVGNNLALYDRLLVRFAHDWRQGAARTAQLMAAGQLVEARRLAHTLKGTAATLGIDGISAEAAAIETQLGLPVPGSIDAALGMLQAGLAETCAAIDARAVLPAEDVARPRARPAPTPANPVQALPDQPVLATISELEVLLDRRNLRARDAADRLKETPLPARCKGPLEQVVGNVARLDYAEAAVALAELKALLAPAPESHP